MFLSTGLMFLPLSLRDTVYIYILPEAISIKNPMYERAIEAPHDTQLAKIDQF